MDGWMACITTVCLQNVMFLVVDVEDKTWCSKDYIITLFNIEGKKRGGGECAVFVLLQG